MISAIRLVYEFDLRYNRLQSAFDTSIRLEDKLAIINNAVRIVFIDLISKAGLSAYYKTALRPLEEKDKKLPIKKVGNSFDIFKIPKDLYRLERMTVLAEKEGCGEKVIPVLFFQTDDLDQSFTSSYWKPSYAWETVIGDSGSEGYYLWHESDFKIKSVNCDYYRFPKEVHAPQLVEPDHFYIDWNGIKRTKNVDLELDADFIFDSVIEVAILVARSIKGDITDFELQLKKILSTKT